MNKTYSLFFLFVLIISQTFSQSKTDVQNILDKLSTKIKSAKGISALFTLTQYDKSNQITGNSKGTIKIKGNKYYLKEDKTEVFSNGVQTWNFDGGTEVMILKTEDADEDDISPQKVLTGFSKADFTYKLVSSSGSEYQILLSPIDKRKNFKQVIIFINKSSNLISKAKITDKSGNLIQLGFSTINLNTIIPDSQFNFDVSKHPGIEVINQ